MLGTTWTTPPGSPDAREDEVHVWRAALDLPAGPAGRLAGLLTAKELAECGRLRFPVAGARLLASRGWLRHILGRYLRADPDALEFRFARRGKPRLSLQDAGHDIRFNLSHSAGLALVAVGLGREVGIDIECVDRPVDAARIGRRCLTPAEFDWLGRICPAGRQEAFYRCWTRKEACAKVHGQGLRLVLRKFETRPDAGDDGLVEVNPDGGGSLSLCSLDPGPGYVGALAVEAGPCRVRLLEAALPPLEPGRS